MGWGRGVLATASNFTGLGATAVSGGTTLGTFSGGYLYWKNQQRAIIGIWSHTSSADLALAIRNQGTAVPNLVQSSFTRLYYLDAAGTLQSVLSSAATFVEISGIGPTGYCQWTWDLPSPVWSSSDDTEVKYFYIVP